MRKPRAIIVDDDPSVRTLLERFLMKKGYEVLSVPDPTFCHVYKKHEEECTAHHVCSDVLITDYMMPKMNGIELLQLQSRRKCKLTNANKAVISGMLTHEVKQAIDSLGCTVISKPFSLEEIAEWLEECEKRFDLSQPVEPI